MSAFEPLTKYMMVFFTNWSYILNTVACILDAILTAIRYFSKVENSIKCFNFFLKISIWCTCTIYPIHLLGTIVFWAFLHNFNPEKAYTPLEIYSNLNQHLIPVSKINQRNFNNIPTYETLLILVIIISRSFWPSLTQLLVQGLGKEIIFGVQYFTWLFTWFSIYCILLRLAKKFQKTMELMSITSILFWIITTSQDGQFWPFYVYWFCPLFRILFFVLLQSYVILHGKSVLWKMIRLRLILKCK